MNLSDLGLIDDLAKYIENNIADSFSIARVMQEQKERYVVSTGDNEYDAEITGNLRFTAGSRSDFPAVGDWVSIIAYDNDFAVIHSVLPRRTILERSMVGRTGEKQIISANVDYAFIMQSIDNNFNLNRLERYLSICYTSSIEPILVISKTDLSTAGEINSAISSLKNRKKNLNYILLSNVTKEGLDQILAYIKKGKTYCVIGSSGVGKSTLINNLLKRIALRTDEISIIKNRGKHTTEHRELFVLDNGGILIDTPGMRELGMTDNLSGIMETFNDIFNLTLKCRFSDCRHIDEKGCAVIEALNNGIIDAEMLANYRKIVREQERFQLSVADKRRKEKQFGKMAKEILKGKKKDKY